MLNFSPSPSYSPLSLFYHLNNIPACPQLNSIIKQCIKRNRVIREGLRLKSSVSVSPIIATPSILQPCCPCICLTYGKCSAAYLKTSLGRLMFLQIADLALFWHAVQHPCCVLEMQMAAWNIDLKNSPSIFHPADVVLALIHTGDHAGDRFKKTKTLMFLHKILTFIPWQELNSV